MEQIQSGQLPGTRQSGKWKQWKVRKKESYAVKPIVKGGVSKVVILQWLVDNYRASETSCVPRDLVYDHYCRYCGKDNIIPESRSVLGKLILEQFPHIKLRRFGCRGATRNFYWGLAAVPDNEMFDAFQENKRVSIIPIRLPPKTGVRKPVVRTDLVKDPPVNRNPTGFTEPQPAANVCPSTDQEAVSKQTSDSDTEGTVDTVSTECGHVPGEHNATISEKDISRVNDDVTIDESRSQSVEYVRNNGGVVRNLDQVADNASLDDGVEMLANDASADKGVELIVNDVGTDKGVELAGYDVGTDKGVELAVNDVGTDQLVPVDDVRTDEVQPFDLRLWVCECSQCRRRKTTVTKAIPLGSVYPGQMKQTPHAYSSQGAQQCLASETSVLSADVQQREEGLPDVPGSVSEAARKRTDFPDTAAGECPEGGSTDCSGGEQCLDTTQRALAAPSAPLVPPNNDENPPDHCQCNGDTSQVASSEQTAPPLDVRWKDIPHQLKKIYRKQAKDWVDEHYEMDPPSCIPRQTVYEHYVQCSRNTCCVPAPVPILGQVLLDSFPLLAMRRLGTRHNSKYYYLGMNIRAESPAYSWISAVRVMSQSKPKLSRAFNGKPLKSKSAS